VLNEIFFGLFHGFRIFFMVGKQKLKALAKNR
jgi:hypothetical protein